MQSRWPARSAEQNTRHSRIESKSVNLLHCYQVIHNRHGRKKKNLFA